MRNHRPASRDLTGQSESQSPIARFVNRRREFPAAASQAGAPIIPQRFSNSDINQVGVCAVSTENMGAEMSCCERDSSNAGRGRLMQNQPARAFEDEGSFQQSAQSSIAHDLRRGQGSSLHAAAMYGDVDQIKSLIVCEGKSVDNRDMLGRTPFRLACKYYQLEAAAELLRFGADIQAVDNSGISVHTAVKIAGQDDVGRWLEEQVCRQLGGPLFQSVVSEQKPAQHPPQRQITAVAQV